ncbi:MAG: DUF1844 domain-containing protein [Planctomycetes bacterium]|nr:DUF1844 domain-containing protein [Planctomycetota bacterium]
MSEEGPKIQIDSDWKAEAQREKERLAQQAKAKAQTQAPAGAAAADDAAGAPGSRPSAGTRELPPANFETLMSLLASQALMYLGAYADPRTGQPMVELDVARHHIDLLAVLEEKTRGNLEDEEARSLASMLYELRSRYVQVANASRQK